MKKRKPKTKRKESKTLEFTELEAMLGTILPALQSDDLAQLDAAIESIVLTKFPDLQQAVKKKGAARK